jgi:hypothetical protein
VCLPVQSVAGTTVQSPVGSGGGQCPLVARWPPPRGTPESDSLLLFLSTPNTINVNCVCYLHSTNWAARCFLLPPPSPKLLLTITDECGQNKEQTCLKNSQMKFKFPAKISITNFWNQNE